MYRGLLDFTLSARFLVLGGTALLALTALAVFPTIDEELLPKEDRGGIYIMLQGPDGVGLDYMDRQSAKAEAILKPLQERGEVGNVMSIVGRWGSQPGVDRRAPGAVVRAQPQPGGDRQVVAASAQGDPGRHRPGLDAEQPEAAPLRRADRVRAHRVELQGYRRRPRTNSSTRCTSVCRSSRTPRSSSSRPSRSFRST